MDLRKIDALVAEKVMGIDLSSQCKGEMVDDVEGCWVCSHCHAEGDFGEEFLPHKIVPYQYSTDISAAWTVVEKFQLVNPDNIDDDDNYPPIRIDAVIRLEDGRWMARFDGPIDFDVDMPGYYERSCYPDCRGFAVAATAPLAICLAALRAVGVDVKELG